MTILALALAGCGPREQVVWDAVGGGDSVDDVAVAVLLFGKVESDREEIEGPHVAGGTLSVNATRHGFSGDGWSATTVEPDIAGVLGATDTGSGLRIDLAFHRQGTTWLHVFDAEGIVIDQQRLEVREAAGAELVPWDDLSAGIADPVAGAIDVVGGSDLSLAVTWTDATGTPLDGGGLLEVSGPGASAGFTGVTDTLDLAVAEGAASFDVELSAAGTPVDARTVVVHDRGEVDALELEPVVLETDEELGDSGIVRSFVLAAGVRMLGAPVNWTWDGSEPLVGSVLLWDAAAGPGTEVTACFDEVCEAVAVPGTPTGVADADAPSASECGCASGGTGGAPWLVVLAALVATLRAPRGSSPR